MDKNIFKFKYNSYNKYPYFLHRFINSLYVFQA